MSKPNTPPAPLGSVTWPGGSPVATLRVDGSWSVPDADWNEPFLRACYSDAYRGPQDGPFGPGILNTLASDVGGTAHIEPRDEPAHKGEIVY